MFRTLPAIFTAPMLRDRRTLRHLGRPLQVIAGVVMIAFGIAIMTGELSAFAVWLLRTFLVFGTIG